MPSAATPSEPIPCSSFVEDPFEQEDLLSLMPKSFEGLLNLDSCDPPYSEQDLHRLLSEEVLKKSDKETQEGNAMLTGMANLETADIYGDRALFCKPESQQSENLEKMVEEPALFKENMPPDENFPHPRLRREGSGRVSNRGPFTIISSSFGSNLNVQKDPRTLQDVYEFFADAERQENAEAILRKMRGEKSPIAFCSQQSLKTRVRRQGTGRRKPSMNFDVKLVADTEKYMQLDGEKLEVEEYPVSSFTRAEQDCDIQIETGGKKINKDASFNVSGHEQCLSETVNDDLRKQSDVQSESNKQNTMQCRDQLSIGHGCEMDDLQLNPVQGKEICGSETEETVNMPPKNLFSFENSARSAFHQLLKDYKKLDGENMLQASFSRSELEINDNENSYPKDVHYDTQCALSQSRAESSNTIHSQCLFADEVKTMIQPHQIPSDFHLAGSDRTPPEDFSQKARETCSPSTSPTPPSNISAALKPGRKRKSVGSGKSRVPCISPLQDRDKEAAKDRTSSTSHVLRTLNPSIQGVSSGVRRLNFDIPSNSPKQAELKSSEGLDNGNATNLVKSSENDDKKSGVMRPRFDSPSKSPKQDEFNSEERLDDGEAVNLVNPSTNCSNNEKVEVVRTDVDLSNVTMLSPQKIIQVNSMGPCNSNTLASANVEHTEKDALVLASRQQNEESPLTFHKKNTKKVKRQAKMNANTCDSDAHEEDKITSKEVVDREKKKRSSEYKRRQSLAGAGTLWKSGVRRSTRIRSRPLEYWRGERFLYGRIHNSLTTVIGIKYSSPGPSQKQKKEVPNFKVKSYVDDQYSHLVEFAASH